MEVQFSSDFVISQQHMDAAMKFGDEVGNTSEINKYIVAFVRKLLLQREKLDKNILKNYLDSEVSNFWVKVLSSLEDKNRKLINIQSGSLILILFCPTRKSRLQLQEENWKTEIQNNMSELLNLLGNLNRLVNFTVADLFHSGAIMCQHNICLF